LCSTKERVACYLKRDEYENTDMKNIYLNSEQFYLVTLRRSVAGLDAGTHEDTADATNLVRTLPNSPWFKSGLSQGVCI
jgi:dTDP-glucose pyrophosphorylase